MAADTAPVTPTANATSNPGTAAPAAGGATTSNPSRVDFLDPATAVGTIVLGVVAGVSATIFLGLCAWFFRDRIVPALQGLMYRGVDLNGKWVQVKTVAPATYHYSLDLRQQAHRLSGRLTISKSGTPHDYTQDFKVSGRAWEGFVVLDMISTNRRQLSFATTLLQVRDRGKGLVGHMAYRSASPPDHVDSESSEWTRG